MSCSYDDLEVLAKFCWNVIDEEMFIELMMPRYNDVPYIRGKWRLFVDDSVMFIVSRGERELHAAILKKIKDMNYDG